MFNLVKDEYDQNSNDILETINKMIADKKEEEKKKDEKTK